ncbi:MAG: YegS/Rv2252/BmrU family lipid kinase [Actinomycetota bacterium]
MVHLLVNSFARKGKGHKRTSTILKAFNDLGVEVTLVEGVTLHEVEANLRNLVSDGLERLIVAGGDGMVHSAIQAVAQSETTLGLIPIGTGNDFCRALGLPTDIENVVETALGEGQLTDLLRVDGRWVASVITFGFSGDVNTRAEAMKWPNGPSRYTLATLAELPSLRSQLVEFEIDGVHKEFDLCLSNIANTSDFGGGMKIAPDANPFDGIAHLTFVSRISRFELLRFFRKVFNGSHMEHPKVIGMTGKNIQIISSDLELWADGELIGSSPAEVELIPEAIYLAISKGNI